MTSWCARHTVTSPPYTVTAKLQYSFLTVFFSPLNRVIAKTRKVRSRITRDACIWDAKYVTKFTGMFKPNKGIYIISRMESNHASIANQPATLLSSVATSTSLVVPIYYASIQSMKWSKLGPWLETRYLCCIGTVHWAARGERVITNQTGHLLSTCTKGGGRARGGHCNRDASHTTFYTTATVWFSLYMDGSLLKLDQEF